MRSLLRKKEKITLRSLSKSIIALLLCIMMTVAVTLTACNTVSSDLSSTGSVIINEAMSSNSAFAVAGDGKYYDWAELYNPTSETVDLSSCYITDTEETPLKFRLQGLSIAPGGYALVYLSGLGGVDVNGYLHANFKLSSTKGETLLLSDKHGNVISRLELPSSIRNVSYGRLDSGKYVWFSTPTPLAENGGGYADSIDKLVFESNSVVINEYMLDNTYIIYDADGDYGDWVELYNPSDNDADMTGYSLTDSDNSPSKWVFPAGTVIPANGYLLVFCDGKNYTDSVGILHTNFSLSTEDTELSIYSNQGIKCDSVPIDDMPSNISCGYPEGQTELKLFARPTPGKKNVETGFELTSRPAPNVNNGVFISEVLSVSSSLTDYAADFIEVHNATSDDVNLGGYTIAQTPGEVAFKFPEMTLRAGDYAVVYCDGTEVAEAGKRLHAAIKINSSGEDFYLAEPDGRICDYFPSGKGVKGVSSGRSGSDSAERCFFSTPTPGSANSDVCYLGYAPMPTISRVGGYTDAGTAIEITAPEGFEIAYTLDGSKPGRSSARYSEPITINRSTVLRAVALKDGYLTSQCATETYLVEDKHSISVVSLSSSPAGLLGEGDGMLVHYKRDIEREVHIEYFDENGSKNVEFDCGAKIFGQYSRSENQKGLRLALREIYGTNEVTYPFFPDSLSGVCTFSNLLLRPCGQDQTRAKLRDELVPAIVRGQMDIDYQEFRACALYINGEYWGLYYIRERLDASYLKSKYGIEEGTYDLVKSQIIAQEGTLDAWIELDNYCRNHDLTKQSNYEYVCSQVDIDSLINYWICETYFANPDSGNIRCYKTTDGKWRWMIYDFDWGMTSSTWKKDYIYMHLLDPKGHGAADFSNALIRKLLQNSDFRDKFISTYCYHLNNTFSSERTLKILDEMASVIRDEIPRQGRRWDLPNETSWQTSLNMLTKFFTNKPDIAIRQLQENFGISDKEMRKYLNENK